MKYDKLMMFFVGLGLGICAWLLMGTLIKPGLGAPRYQVSTFSAASEAPTGTRGWWGYVIIDTTTGKVVQEQVNHKGY
jgi:hypothetical protein